MSELRVSETEAKTRRRLSFQAVVVGWAAGMMFFIFKCFHRVVFGPSDLDFFDGDTVTMEVTGTFFTGLFMAASVYVIWIVAVLPITLHIPSKSWLWNPIVCTLGGILAGPLILIAIGLIVNFTIEHLDGYSPFLPLSDRRQIFEVFLLPALIGGVTCYSLARSKRCLGAEAS